MFSCMCKNVFPTYSSAKIIFKNQTNFSRVMITNVLPRLQRAAMLALQALYLLRQFCPSVRPSVCLSVTRRNCVKTTARSTVQFALSDSKMCLVL